MSTTNRPADGKITSGRGLGEYVYCFTDRYPIKLEYDRLIVKDLTLISTPGFYTSDGTYLFNTPDESKSFFSFTPQIIARIDVLASTTTGPSASNFVAGTLIGGVALGAAAAMAPMGSTHTVKVTWRDNRGESIITFNNSNGFQNFIGKLGNLMNQPNEATPALSSPAISSADEILKFKKLMDEGIITQAEFDAKKKQLLGIDNTVINSSETNIVSSGDNNPEYYSVILASYNDWKMAVIKAYKDYKSCGLDEAMKKIDSTPFEIIGTTSKTEAEQVAKIFTSVGATVEIEQPKSDGGFNVTTFKSKYETYEDQPKAEAIDLEAKQKEPVVGDEIYFGADNGQKIRWKVLEKEDRNILVITTKIVCKMPYHQTDEDITWSECTLRKWLNSDFINKYFTRVERDKIVPWELNNDNNPEYKTPGGVRTTDKVFLLSIDEAKSLFADDLERGHGCYGIEWWLRSSGVCPTNAAAVHRDGSVSPNGFGITSKFSDGGVRPALWLDLTSSKWCEEAKKRYDDYWEAHSDERKELEAEQEALKEQINSLNVSCNMQVEALEKEIAAIPGKDEIDSLDARIKKLSDEKAALGIFKGKEKKALQEQIYLAEADKKAAQNKMAVAKSDLEAKISAVQREFKEKNSSLQSRSNHIDTELNKAR